MQYTIDQSGIHYSWTVDTVIVVADGRDDDQDSVIPDSEAVEIVKQIAAKQQAFLDACECLQQGAQPCGACGREPARLA